MLRVLIIEDEQVNREFLLLALRPYGDCVAAGTGEAGLREHRRALAESAPFQLVFLDIMLPGIDGLKALEMLRAAEEEFDVPDPDRALVIVTTVLDDDQSAARAFIQGRAASFMTKPFRVGQLREELAKLGFLHARDEASL
jgi:two-component system chemotaxis response regulator CheY